MEVDSANITDCGDAQIYSSGVDQPSSRDTDRNQTSWQRLLDEFPETRGALLHDVRLKHGRLLGRGFFGKVYRGVFQSGNDDEVDVAMKTLDELNFDDIRELSKEGLRMQNLKHENVLGLIGIGHDEYYRPVLISEFMENGDLRTLLRDRGKRFEINTLLEFGHQIARGMEYLHDTAKMVHRDLAARNCMVTIDLNVKVADFGLSRYLDNDGNYVSLPSNSSSLPWKWCALELFTCQVQQFNQKTDVWSYGVVLWEITTFGCVPYENVPTLLLRQWLISGERLPKPQICPDSLYAVMLSCWSENPQNRRDFGALVVSFADVIGSWKTIADTTAEQQIRDSNEFELIPVRSAARGSHHLTTPRESDVNEPEDSAEADGYCNPCRLTRRRAVAVSFAAVCVVFVIVLATSLSIEKRTDPVVSVLNASSTDAAPFNNVTTLSAPRVFIIGGIGNDSKLLASVEVFDLKQQEFLRDVDLPVARAFFGAATLGSFVYAIGGCLQYQYYGAVSTTDRIDIDNSSQPLQRRWRSRSPMSTARDHHALAATSTTIFALGGKNKELILNTMEAFDSRKQRWTPLREMPTARSGFVASIVGDFLYAAGGYNVTYDSYGYSSTNENVQDYMNLVERYKIGTGNWSTVSPMAIRRTDSCSAVIDENLYVIGGLGYLNHFLYYAQFLSSAEVYSPISDTWSRIADMSTPRRGCGATAFDGHIYVFGGQTNADTFTDSIEVYEPPADKWKFLSARMMIGRASFGVAAVPAAVMPPKSSPLDVIDFDVRPAEHVYLIGGSTNSDSYTSSVEVFDSKDETFSEGAHLQEPRNGLGATIVEGFIYAVGGNKCAYDRTPYGGSFQGYGNTPYGRTTYGNATSTVERLNIENGSASTWENCKSMPTPRSFLAVATSSKIIFALGGRRNTAAEPTLRVLEASAITTTQSWTRLEDMQFSREGFAAAVIGDDIYAAGGHADNAHVGRVVEKYNIRTGEWSSVAAMQVSRESPCAAVLDGKLFVIGGKDTNVTFFYLAKYLSSVEMYSPSTDEWNLIADMSTRRWGCGATAVGHLIYVFGGRSDEHSTSVVDSVEVYNPSSDSWLLLSATMKIRRAFFGITSTAPTTVIVHEPQQTPKPLATVQTVSAPAHRVFIIGGEWKLNHELSSVEIFDSMQKTFSAGPDLPSPRIGFGAAVLDNYVYVVGGEQINRNDDQATVTVVCLSASDRLKVGSPLPNSPSWEIMNPMKTARGALAVVASFTTIFAVGGWNNETRYTYNTLGTLEAFDLRTKRWTTLREMPTARYEFTASVIGDFLYAAGGVKTISDSDYYGLTLVEKYKISTNIWSTVSPMQTGRSYHCSAVLDGKLFVIGGYSEDRGGLSSAEVYNPVKDTWDRIAGMSTVRAGCGAASIDGLIYVFGGTEKTDAFLGSVEVYNSKSDSWQTLSAHMNVSRASFGIAVL